jgi:AAA family ATP:ADP antiporter
MLYTVAAPEEKYKAKSFIDTVVYRGGDAIGGWVKRALDVIAEHPAIAMVIGAVIALGWAATGAWLGRQEQRREGSPQPKTDSR